jgi:hypothetical protein
MVHIMLKCSGSNHATEASACIFAELFLCPRLSMISQRLLNLQKAKTSQAEAMILSLRQRIAELEQ